MKFYTGQYSSQMDSKFRVGIPAPFRAVLKERCAAEDVANVVLRASHQFPCIDGLSVGDQERLSLKLFQMDEFSADRENMILVLLGQAKTLTMDDGGRIVIPEDLRRYAGLEKDKELVLIGGGDKFQIWEPNALKERLAVARAAVPGIKLPGGAA
jgi:MraZ protein